MNKIQIFSFHSISDKKSVTYPSIPVRVFKKICSFLSRNYFIIPLEEISYSHRTSKTIGIITFDDGFYDFYENALEILNASKFSATQNIIVNCVNTGETLWTQKLNDLLDCFYNQNKKIIIPQLNISSNIHNKSDFEKLCLKIYFEILQNNKNLDFIQILENSLNHEVSYTKMMNWNEIIECSEYNISFGSHTMSHQNLTLLNQDDLDYEVKESKYIIENELQGKSCDIIAYPNGIYNSNVVEACKNANYKFMLTTMHKSIKNPVNCFDLPRFNIYNETFYMNLLKILKYKYLSNYER